jgi:hypothetical protein
VAFKCWTESFFTSFKGHLPSWRFATTPETMKPAVYSPLLFSSCCVSWFVIFWPSTQQWKETNQFLNCFYTITATCFGPDLTKLPEDDPKCGPKHVPVIKWKQFKKSISCIFIAVLTARIPQKNLYSLCTFCSEVLPRRMPCFGVWRRVVRQKLSDFSEEHTASIFRV